MEVEVLWARLDAAHHGLEASLRPAELERIRRLERPADRGRSLLGAALVRAAAGARLGIAPRDVVVDRTCDECGRQHGAPRVLHDGAPWVTVSHSGLLVVVAFAAAPLGVDVQRLADLPSPVDGQAWVRAEATAKARGVARTAALALGPLVVRRLATPLTGYAAALALPVSAGNPRLQVTGP